MLLIDRSPQGSPIDLTRRGEDDALESTELLCDQENVGRPHDVGVDHLLGMLVRVRDADEGGEVKDGVSTADDLAHRVDVADVAKGDLDLPHHGLGDVAETSSFGTRGIPQHRPNSGARRHEALNKSAADETRLPR